ncbi:hypothetical protein [Amycolatopsis taiwanensis]|uniref:hypothetical protein n=1 Tax=Amycolatopsis taiwanensis TaxID=342230 RepID=UPI000488CFD1|nr:hypothetical protein [Amycolatopsis taiwanensis]
MRTVHEGHRSRRGTPGSRRRRGGFFIAAGFPGRPKRGRERCQRTSPASRWPHKPTAALLSTIPVAVLFFRFKRYYIHGAVAGLVKN